MSEWLWVPAALAMFGVFFGMFWLIGHALRGHDSSTPGALKDPERPKRRHL